MRRLLMTAAVALCAAAAPAIADEVDPNWGITGTELNCLHGNFGADLQYHIGLDVGRQLGKQSPDPIAECNVAEERVAAAMDALIDDYNSNDQRTSTWVASHCHAEPAIPRNKWVCTEGDVVREYH